MVSPDWKGPGWYRITEPAGSRIPEFAPKWGYCGTATTGWLNGTHPAVPGQQKDMSVCFNWVNSACEWNTTATVRNCGGYFLYKLPNTPSCYLRYCAV